MEKIFRERFTVAVCCVITSLLYLIGLVWLFMEKKEG